MRIIILTLNLFALFSLSHSEQPSGSLDSILISKLYQGGDFDRAVPILDSLLKSKQSLNHSDSIFAFKYLGVMYLANDKTKELGKYYILQLLRIEPDERLLDMYPSDKIYATFKIVLDEFTASQSKTIPQKKHEVKKTPNRKAYYWAGAVSVMAGIGVTTFFLSRENPDKIVDLVVQ